MDCVIHVNTTSRLLNTLTSRLSQAGTAFQDAAADARTAAAAQYRERIEALIHSMPVAPSRLGDNFRIDISEAGYAAMERDPAYQDFVLSTIRAELAAPSLPNTGTATVLLQFGDDPASFRKHTFATGDDFFHVTDNHKSFWEERMERQEKLEETNAQIADVRKRAEALAARKRRQGESVSAAELSAASEILTILLGEILGSRT